MQPQFKILPIFTFIAFLALLGTLAPYFYIFSGVLSQDSKDWANFGSYIGGTLSPIIAALGIVGLVANLKQQSKQIIDGNKQHNLQKLESIVHLLEADFRRHLFQQKVCVKGTEYPCEYILLCALFDGFHEAIVSMGFLQNPPEGYADHDIIVGMKVGQAAHVLRLIVSYVNEHSKLSGDTVFSKYYHSKYNLAWKRLVKLGYIEENTCYIKMVCSDEP